jgi:hypothetical protein
MHSTTKRVTWYASPYFAFPQLIHLEQWVIIDAKVYNISKFADLHPGGSNVLFAESVGKCRQQIDSFGLIRGSSWKGRDTGEAQILKLNS